MEALKHAVNAGVYLVFERGSKVLIVRYAPNVKNAGQYGVPGGHIESGEPASGAAIREAREQVGIHLRLAELRLAHVMHRASGADKPVDNIDFYFMVMNFPGEAVDRMPQTYDKVEWVAWNRLPQNTTPEVRYALECIKEDKIYSEFDFLPS